MCSPDFLKRSPKRYQSPALWARLEFFSPRRSTNSKQQIVSLSTEYPKRHRNSAIALTLDLLRLNTQRSIKTVFLTPKITANPPRPFYIGWSPPPRQRGFPSPILHLHFDMIHFYKILPLLLIVIAGNSETFLVLTSDILLCQESMRERWRGT